MRFIAFILLSMIFFYSESAYSTLYSCDIFKDKQKITTLTGSLNNSELSGRMTNTQATDPNTALAFTLCQQAGLQPVNVMLTIPGIRASSSVTKNQLLPNPACTLKCTPL
ncbi:MAG: hypothetical protein V4496_07835 [Pseudomonadota bacterium]